MSLDGNRPEEPAEAPGTNKFGLTEDEMNQLRRAQKRNLVLAIVGGLILFVMGYFAAQNLSDAAALAAKPSMEVVNVWPL
ncbi:hypothetical protein [Trueperella pecoris]|uniref:Uncharacterized protein n=1 Tax=Trueperella pecoris TaxID=2733571 RepID=A0A7M1QYY8_9ACTO|nr:hypothetical protein [Trueperella pecoris]QOR46397.1 hypothetical protein INS88_04130 [Trueperella pecoris]QTG76222.1 hypothetical protein J4179_04045 [Trueperella pecoris]